MYYYGPLHMDEQRQDDQLERTYSSSVRILGVALRTCQKRWMIGRGGEKGSGISMPMAQQNDNGTVKGWLKKFCLDCKNLDDQASSGRPKTLDSKFMLQPIEVTPMSSTWVLQVTVECGLSPSQLWQKHPELLNCLSLLKYCKTFDSP